jgi:methanogenic corrinoid protein MtbC1
MEIEQLTAEERSLLDSMKDAIVALEEEQAIAAAEKAVAQGIDPKIAIRYAVASAAITVG